MLNLVELPVNSLKLLDTSPMAPPDFCHSLATDDIPSMAELCHLADLSAPETCLSSMTFSLSIFAFATASSIFCLALILSLSWSAASSVSLWDLVYSS